MELTWAGLVKSLNKPEVMSAKILFMDLFANKQQAYNKQKTRSMSCFIYKFFPFASSINIEIYYLFSLQLTRTYYCYRVTTFFLAKGVKSFETEL